MNLGKITFRQYMALTLIFSKFSTQNKAPSKEEIKKIIGMRSDRMLEITLRALERKGLIKFHGLQNEPIVGIPENEELRSILTDKLMLIEESKTFKEIKQIAKHTIPRENLRPPKIGAQLHLIISPRQLRELNNESRIVHRWYEYLQDFPPSLVWDKLVSYSIRPGMTVLDPFVGSGTTVVTAKMMGINAIGVDVNPVAYFATQVKTKWDVNLKELKEEATSVLRDLSLAKPLLEKYRLKTEFIERMPRMELNQWLTTKLQNEVAYVKERIKDVEDDDVRRLLMLGLASAAVESSNVAFCPGTTFYPFRERPPFYDAFRNKLNTIYEDLFHLTRLNLKYGHVSTFDKDCREMPQFIEHPIDFIITSPPYPNDLEYTRQTRLELYLLDYVKSMQDVRKIKEKMVKGSTKLIFKESNSSRYVEKFKSVQVVADEIAKALSDRKWGWDYPRMVREYFGDLYLTLIAFKEILKDGAHALMVVGDQTYKHILIPVGRIIVELAKDLGFRSAGLELLRVRQSTLHNIPLREEIVTLKK